MNVCSIWLFAQISDDFYYLDIWQCARYFVAALFKELQLWSLRPPNMCVVHLFFRKLCILNAALMLSIDRKK